jgi:hypothetical protein
VSKLFALEHLELALSEKQIPQIVENSKKCGELLEPLEGDGMRPRQVRYQAALRPDTNGLFDSKLLCKAEFAYPFDVLEKSLPLRYSPRQFTLCHIRHKRSWFGRPTNRLFG